MDKQKQIEEMETRESKKIFTAEEVIKALECMANSLRGTSGYTIDIIPYALDLIRRLQGENERLSLIAGTVSKGVAVEIVNMQETIDKQNTEIEQLTKENNKLKIIVDHNCDPFPKWQEAIIEEKAELQKQVDELNDKLYESKQDMMVYHSNQMKQAVKDTAKEIYEEIDKSDILVVETQEYGEIEVVPIERLKEIIESKGVEGK